MAFPVVEATNTSSRNSDGTSHTVNLPAGIQAGDLLIMFFSIDGSSSVINEPAGWSTLSSTSYGSVAAQKIFYKEADGAEGSTLVVTSAGSQKSAHNTYRISGANQTPEISSPVYSTNNAPNPPSLSPSGGEKDYLWIAYTSTDKNSATNGTISGGPITYTLITATATGTGGVNTGTAYNSITSATEDPNNFALTANEKAHTFTLAISPGGGGGAGGGGSTNGLSTAISIGIM